MIPGLRAADRGGQSAHREALKTAIAAAEIDTELYGTITPHGLRAYLATDLKDARVYPVLAIDAHIDDCPA